MVVTIYSDIGDGFLSDLPHSCWIFLLRSPAKKWVSETFFDFFASISKPGKASSRNPEKRGD